MFIPQPLQPITGSEGSASVGSPLSTVVDLVKQANKVLEDFLNIMSSTCTCFQKITLPLAGQIAMVSLIDQ
jgi:hypothetical protein